MPDIDIATIRRRIILWLETALALTLAALLDHRTGTGGLATTTTLAAVATITRHTKRR